MHKKTALRRDYEPGRPHERTTSGCNMSNKPVFPCVALPEDLHHCKLLGMYPQRQDGLWMQRIVVTAGRLSGPQWAELGQLARTCTPGTPLHLTTRQDVEFHMVTPQQAPAIQASLAAVGLTCVGGGGDTLRNVTVCPCSGVAAGEVELLPLARQIQQVLGEYENLFGLPRKFKISLSACENACGQPWINDLGLVAVPHGGTWRFKVIAAGSLGHKPGTGLLCIESLPAEDVLPLVLAAVRLFDAHGDREHRFTARLRHVRQRVGDAAFVQMLTAELDKAKAERPWPAVQLVAPQAMGGKVTLTFPNGDITPEMADALADLAGDPALAVRISNWHRIMIFGRDQVAAAKAVAAKPALAQAVRPQPSVITCPGTRWCKRGVVDTNAAADRIREVLPATYGGLVAVSGCPNGCAHSAVADIGLTGQILTEQGQRKEAFVLWLGGGCGRDERLGQPSGVVESSAVADNVKEVARASRP